MAEIAKRVSLFTYLLLLCQVCFSPVGIISSAECFQCHGSDNLSVVFSGWGWIAGGCCEPYKFKQMKHRGFKLNFLTLKKPIVLKWKL